MKNWSYNLSIRRAFSLIGREIFPYPWGVEQTTADIADYSQHYLQLHHGATGVDCGIVPLVLSSSLGLIHYFLPEQAKSIWRGPFLAIPSLLRLPVRFFLCLPCLLYILQSSGAKKVLGIAQKQYSEMIERSLFSVVSGILESPMLKVGLFVQ